MKSIIRLFCLLLTIFLITSALFGCVRVKPKDRSSSSESVSSSVTSGNDKPDSPVDDGKISLDTFKLACFMAKNYSIYEVPDIEPTDEDDYLTQIRDFLESFDDKYAYFYTDDEMKILLEDKSGNLCGIGVSSILNYDDETVEVINVYEDSPANSYLKSGDLLLGVKIEDKMVRFEELVEEHVERLKALEDSADFTEEEIRNSALYYAFDEMIANIRGEEGTKATLVYGRDDTENEVSIIRAHITAHSVNYSRLESDNSIGLIRISQFDYTTYPQFREALDDIVPKGVNKLIIDLRGNPGGSVETLNSMLSLLTPEGTFLYCTKDAFDTEEKVYSEEKIYGNYSEFRNQTILKKDLGKYSGIPMAILIDGDSASASEIFSGVLRDVAGAKLIGEKSFGKGIIQTTFGLKNVYDYYSQFEDFKKFGIGDNISGYLKITTDYDVLPVSGSFHTHGLEPDIAVALTEEQSRINVYKRNETNDEQIKKAVEVLNNK